MIVALGLLAFAAGNLQAQIVQTLTITATALVQNTNAPTDNGTITTGAKPIKKSFITKDLMQRLAKDEFAAGHWSSNSFPASAKLVSVNGDFQVVKGTNLLLSVTNILSIANTGNNQIFSQKFNDATGSHFPPFSETSYQLITLTYDARPIGGMFHFSLTGLGVSTTTALAPNPTTGIYTETDSGSIQSGAGEGFAPDGTTPFVITGTASAMGTGKLRILN